MPAELPRVSNLAKKRRAYVLVTDRLTGPAHLKLTPIEYANAEERAEEYRKFLEDDLKFETVVIKRPTEEQVHKLYDDLKKEAAEHTAEHFLSDDTRVSNVTWRDLRKRAMKEDYSK